MLEYHGLSNEDVQKRIDDLKVNKLHHKKTKSFMEIIVSNVFTYFNLLNIFLGSCILITGFLTGNFFNSLKNCLFLGVVCANTVISIYQEINAKRILDKMNLLVNQKVSVIRDGKIKDINIEDIVIDDIINLYIGNQIVVDGFILSGEIEVNESLLTGESDSILKTKCDKLLSGSFVVSGKCYMKVSKVGDNSYLNSFSKEAHIVKRNKSIIFNSFEKLIKVLSLIILPLGILLFLNQYYLIPDNSFYNAVVGTIAALIGMIPEGLVLLTSSVMAISVIRLSQYNVLVQELYSIEGLARVNAICLDKTGTITTGKMKLKDYIPYKITKDELKEIIIKILNILDDNSMTFKAIREYFNEVVAINNEGIIPFSSERKFSACRFDNYSYYIGAGEYLLGNDSIKEIQKEQDLYRVIVIARNKDKLSKNPKNLELVGYLLIEDEIRKDAKKTLDYFKEQGVKVKIISGDNYKTVLTIANKIGLKNIRGIDTTNMKKDDMKKVCDYDIFGRVTPQNKKMLIEALKEEGYYVAMTGDGVNDVLALNSADCSIAIGTGSDAAKSVANLVLLDSNFDSLPKIVLEGRRTINNIERSSSLLLVKTIYTILLIFTCLFFQADYFFIPIQLTLINACTIGIPSFILALEPNKNLVDGEGFLSKIMLQSLPGSLTVFINIIIILLIGIIFNLSDIVINTLCVLQTASTGFIHLFNVCRPFNKRRIMLFLSLIILFIYAIIFQNEFFNISELNIKILIILSLLLVFSVQLYFCLKKLIGYLVMTKPLRKK